MILPLYNPAIEVTCVGVVHLLRNEDEAKYADILQRADFIFAQNVQDEFPCTFVRKSELLSRYGQKVVFWYNLYFSGYNPELFYMRLDDRTPLRGPLGDYQNRTFFEGWKRGLSVEQTLGLHGDMEFNQERYSSIPEASLAELRRREQAADVRLFPTLEELVWAERLFFTFNHPCLRLLQMAALELLRRAGIDARPEVQSPGPEPLETIRPPLNPWIAQACGMGEPWPNRWFGLAVERVQEGNVVVGNRKEYSAAEVVGIFFKIYEANRDMLLSREWG